ncbi:MAG: transcription antitermination factor NusB [candidate division Zixibacteria bacterium]|nr:transcription antitermination factor NusB [candidate division Zixibacteria bacterium]
MRPDLRQRRRGRELALQALYGASQRARNPIDTLDELPGWALASETSRDFALTLLERMQQHADEIDRRIASVVRNWELRRMARVDDCILRLGTCELFAFPDIPAAVSINEAIELAKKYSTEQSGRFVNGILDAIASETAASERKP